jgi:polyisoprenoid-binding protein YceI
LKSGIERRDEHMLKWLAYSQNPTATFRLKSWKQEGEDSFAVGELSIHGVQKEIQMPVKIKRKGNQYEIDGTANLDYQDFGLPKIRSALVFSVNPHLRVQFHLVSKAQE